MNARFTILSSQHYKVKCRPVNKMQIGNKETNEIYITLKKYDFSEYSF